MIQYARGKTPRDYNHIEIFDGMGFIEEGMYSLKTLGNQGWKVVNINGWSQGIANVLFMREDVKSESVGVFDHQRWVVESISETGTIKKEEMAVGSVG